MTAILLLCLRLQEVVLIVLRSISKRPGLEYTAWSWGLLITQWDGNVWHERFSTKMVKGYEQLTSKNIYQGSSEQGREICMHRSLLSRNWLGAGARVGDCVGFS
jgi:hypothetical protein